MEDEKRNKKSNKEERVEIRLQNANDIPVTDHRRHDIDDATYNTGFDRGIDFSEIKTKLITAYANTIKLLNVLTEIEYNGAERKLVNRLIYILIAMIQLMNGSRISEACYAFCHFIENGDFDKRIVVKLAKSETTKYKDNGEQFKTKIRYRKIIFPLKWIPDTITPRGERGFLSRNIIKIQSYLDKIHPDSLKKRVLDYLLKYHDCNTHSLRYAYINYMIYDQKNEPSLVAKHVGHSNLNQLIRYTQNKQADKLFDVDI